MKVTLSLVLLFLASASGYQTSRECGTTLENLGVAGLRPVLIPCLAGSNELCCTSLFNFAGWTPEAVVGGCFCHNAVMERLTARLDRNSLANRLGFVGADFATRLVECGVPYIYGVGCGESTQPEEATQSTPDTSGESTQPEEASQSTPETSEG